jgi:murein DD-endopeptidase MepM/ murein hydrolase activator NlpD
VRALRVGVPVCLALGGLTLFGWTREASTYAASPLPVAITPAYSPLYTLRDPHASPVGDVSADGLPLRAELSRGDTLGSVLQGFGVEPAASRQIIGSVSEYTNVRRLRAGDTYTAYLSADRTLKALELEIPARGTVRVDQASDGWRAAWHPYRRRVEAQVAHGVVEGPFEAAVAVAGAPRSLAYSLADVFRWDIDFNRDLRRGDEFEVLYELVYLDDRPAGVGNVLAASYTSGGRTLEAYRYGDGGYYDDEGRPLKKMFLRSPLKFSRITSRFSLHRFHPILKRYMPHYGVDYGAPTGTPVHVTANGVVQFVGRSRGGGNMVKVRHSNGYLTGYLHLSRFARGVHRGVRVAQGQVVGYVGSTGLATASHLDYRVRHNGRWINPLSLRSVPAKPIPAARMAAFVQWRDTLRDSMRTGKPLDRSRLDVDVDGVLTASADDGTSTTVASGS